MSLKISVNKIPLLHSLFYKNYEGIAIAPPPPDEFLLLNGQNFLLLDGQNFDLLSEG